MDLLSIVIPVYNTAATLPKCIDSVANQSYMDIEIILVDDGSTDDSSSICDQRAKADTRIKVIHQANGGLSDARNTGIAASTGKYITFIDSDDFIQDDTLSLLMGTLCEHPEYDILEYPLYKNYGCDKEEKLSFACEEYTDMTSYWLNAKAYLHSYACNKIYRKSLFDNIEYPKGKVFEDIAILPELLKAANVVATTTKGLYYYCWNPKGISVTAGAKEWKMLLDAHINYISTSNIKFDSVTAQQYLMHVVNIQIYTHNISGIPATLPSIHVDNWMQMKPFSSKVKALLYNMLGTDKLCKIYRIITPRKECH